MYNAFFDRVEKDKSKNTQEENERKAAILTARLFKQQHDFATDPARFKTIRTGRRGGKTSAAGTVLVHKCLTQPGASCLYITITRSRAKKLMFEYVMKLDRVYQLGVRVNWTELAVYFNNGSVLQCTGAETEADIEKMRGDAYDLVVIDECASFPDTVLDPLINDAVMPTLGDRLGSLVLTGTPGAILKGTFYEATRQDSVVGRLWEMRNEPHWQTHPWQWSNHRWSVKDNVKLPHLWEEDLRVKAMKGWADDNPTWMREYLGQWIADDAAMVYRFSDEKNAYDPLADTAHGLPEDQEWEYIMGVDLGYDDDFAITVAAFSETCTEMYQVYEFSAPGMTVDECARKILQVRDEFGEMAAIVGDQGGLGKQIFATMAEKYGIHIEAAVKTDKRDFIEILNSEMHAGRVKILRNSQLASEMLCLQWDETGRKEDKNSSPNHVADAFLYLWRYSYHHFARAKERELIPGSIEHGLYLQELAIEKASEEYKKRESMDWWDDGRPLDGKADWEDYDA